MQRFFFLGTGCQEVHVWATGPDADHRRAAAQLIWSQNSQMAGKHERGVSRKKNLNGKQLDFFFWATPLRDYLPFGIFGAGLGGREVRQPPRAHCPLAACVKSVCSQPLPRKRNLCRNKKSQVCVSDGVWVHLNRFRKLMKNPWCNQIASLLSVSGSGNCSGHPILLSQAWRHCLNAQFHMRWRNK